MAYEEEESMRKSSPGIQKALVVASEAVKLTMEVKLGLNQNMFQREVGLNVTCATL